MASGINKPVRLDGNLLAAEMGLTPLEMQELETVVSTIPIVGDRYQASQQSQVENQWLKAAAHCRLGTRT